MIWGSIPSEERLRLWKKLRADISGVALDEQLREISKFCSTIPYGARTLDYYSSENWPTPWEILFHGSFCTSSISLLMFYTVILVNGSIPIELLLVEDIDGQYLLPLVDNKSVMNYELGKVNNISELQDSIKVLQRYDRDSVKIK